MNNKYYTPELEEIHVGLECEWQSEIREQNWEKEVFDTDLVSIAYDQLEHADIEEPFEEQFTIKFLDEKDLEELGWNVHEKGIEKKVFGGEWRVHYLKPRSLQLQYSDDVDWEAGFELYNVKVKNKSEMKKLMQMLNIV